ncbi:MAG: hypothetical protein WC010_02845 [Candidatus Absconditabacterales bacterium]
MNNAPTFDETPTNNNILEGQNKDLFPEEILTILLPFKAQIEQANKKRSDSLKEFAQKIDVPAENYNNLPKAFEDITYSKIIEKEKKGKTIMGICGPGASGKNTVKEMLSEVKMVINTTTRAQRQNETEGVHYNFLNEEQFQKSKDNGDFLSTTNRPGRGNYGIRKNDILGTMKDNKAFVIEENPETIFQVSEKLKEIDDDCRIVLIYILPPDPIIFNLSSRLAKRSLTSGESADSLLDTVLGERQHEEFLSVLKLMDKMDVLFVVNDKPQRAKELIESIYLEPNKE